jgi:apolipoprotein N-acyltransferase
LNEAAKTALTDIDIFVGPETAVQGHIDLNNLPESWATKAIKSFLKDFPESRFIIGAETRKAYRPGEQLPHSARQSEEKNIWHTYYNTALQVDTSFEIQVYHKSQLVSGVEKMPFSRYLSFLQRFQIKLGGTFGSLGYQNHRSVFQLPGKTRVAPVICYESVYGEFVTDYVKEGADLICIITNDGWWKNSAGIYQHLNLARLRAIETRRSVARSANTGISAFINQRGDILQELPWGKRGTITEVVNANSYLTFYVKHGDFLGKIAFFLTIILVAWFLYLKFGLR